MIYRIGHIRRCTWGGPYEFRRFTRRENFSVCADTRPYARALLQFASVDDARYTPERLALDDLFRTVHPLYNVLLRREISLNVR